MSILKLKPSCKDYLWGGSKLIKDYGKEYAGDVLAETWELSCHPDGPSVIDGGEYSGRTLAEYIEEKGKDVSAGAVTQAGETENAAGKIEEMGRSFQSITDYVVHLGNAAGQMRKASMESDRFMQELREANEKTVKAFSKVSEHTQFGSLPNLLCRIIRCPTNEYACYQRARRKDAEPMNL